MNFVGTVLSLSLSLSLFLNCITKEGYLILEKPFGQFTQQDIKNNNNQTVNLID
jgi:hypothetical protein